MAMTQSEINPTVLYTLADSARILGRCSGTVKAWVDAGKLAGTRLSDGSRVVFGASLLDIKRQQQAQ